MIHAMVGGKIVAHSAQVRGSGANDDCLLIVEYKSSFKDSPAHYVGVFVPKATYEKCLEAIDKGWTINFQVDCFIMPRREYWEFDTRPLGFVRSAFRLY